MYIKNFKTFEFADFSNSKIQDETDKILPIGTEVVCIDGIQDVYNVKGWRGVIIDHVDHGRGHLDGAFVLDFMYGIELYNAPVSRYLIFKKLVKELEPHEYERLLKKKKELRLKYMNIDPYGEENWVDVENQNNE